jgi:hypothetical protein
MGLKLTSVVEHNFSKVLAKFRDGEAGVVKILAVAYIGIHCTSSSMMHNHAAHAYKSYTIKIARNVITARYIKGQHARNLRVLRSEDAFVITCVASLVEVKVLYVQQDLRYEISSDWRFSV